MAFVPGVGDILVETLGRPPPTHYADFEETTAEYEEAQAEFMKRIIEIGGAFDEVVEAFSKVFQPSDDDGTPRGVLAETLRNKLLPARILLAYLSVAGVSAAVILFGIVFF